MKIEVTKNFLIDCIVHRQPSMPELFDYHPSFSPYFRTGGGDMRLWDPVKLEQMNCKELLGVYIKTRLTYEIDFPGAFGIVVENQRDKIETFFNDNMGIFDNDY